MRATGKVQRQGNSLCLAVPRPLLHRLRWTLGTVVHFDVTDDGRLVVEALDHRYARLLSYARPDAATEKPLP